MADSTDQEPAEPGHTGAVAADPYDRIAWRDLYDRSAALRELADGLAARHAHTTDLLADAFLAAYLAAPRVREAAEMAPSRLFNRQVVAELTASPGFAVLRRETAGDPYAAALAVLAQASLSINYRTPEEVMAEAEPVIRAALPDANVPTSVRRSGVPV
ncbi:hypothetical protein ACWGQZ_30355, partial [Streptomyces koyangensis]